MDQKQSLSCANQIFHPLRRSVVILLICFPCRTASSFFLTGPSGRSVAHLQLSSSVARRLQQQINVSPFQDRGHDRTHHGPAISSLQPNRKLPFILQAAGAAAAVSESSGTETSTLTSATSPPYNAPPSSFAQQRQKSSPSSRSLSSSSSSEKSNSFIGISSDDQVLNLLRSLRIRSPPWIQTERFDCTTRSFNYILRLLADSGHADAGQWAEAILRYMLNQQQQPQHQQQPMGTVNRRSEVENDGDSFAQSQRARPELQPDVITLNTCLDSYANQCQQHRALSSSASFPSISSIFEHHEAAARAAQRLFDTWQNEWYPKRWVAQPVDRISYNTLMLCYGKAGLPHQAQRVFDEMTSAAAMHAAMETEVSVAQGESATLDLEPDAISYSTLLNAYASAGQTEHVTRLFHDLLVKAHAHEETSSSASSLLTIHSYNAVLYAYTKSTNPYDAVEFLQWWHENARNESALAKNNAPSGLAIFPDTTSYNIALHALSLSAATTDPAYDTNIDQNDEHPKRVLTDRAQALFDDMTERDEISYTTLLSVYSHHLPNATAFCHMVQSLLDRAHNETSNIRVNANLISNVLYTMATAYSDDKSMPACADKLVENHLIQRGVRLNRNLYNAWIYCWAGQSSGAPDATKRVLQLLNEMEGADRKRRISPDVKTYTNVLLALSKSRDRYAVSTAERIVQRMERSNSNNNNSNGSNNNYARYRRGPGGQRPLAPPPNVHVYTSLMQVYARSRLPNKATKAADVLQRMKQNNVRPNIVTYNAVLNACEHTDATNPVVAEAALKVAFVTFDEIRSAPVRANHVTYGTFLGVLANLMPTATVTSSGGGGAGARLGGGSINNSSSGTPGRSTPPLSRQQLVELVMRRCQMEGQVSQLVLKKLFDAVDQDQARYRELLRGQDVRRMPASWTANVREARARNHE